MKLPSSLAKKLSIKQIESDLQVMLLDQTDWEDPWRSIIKYVMPGRGAFISDQGSRKRTLVTNRILNNKAKEAAGTLAAALQSGLTSPTTPWIEFEWETEEAKEVDALKRWLQDAQSITLNHLGGSNFYDVMYSYYLDLATFCTSAVHSGAGVDSPLTFDNYAIGEYVFQMGADGLPNKFIQVRWMKYAKIKEMYNEENIPDSIKSAMSMGDSTKLDMRYPVVKAVYKEEHRGNPYVSIHYIKGMDGNQPQAANEDSVLQVRTYESCPNHVGRWDILPNEELGTGPGFDALPHIRRLQEQEKTLMMMAHKAGDPPVNIPPELKGRANLLPGGENYLRGDKRITSIYDTQPDLNAMSALVDRSEERIDGIFYNDVFITNSRDPNASPLRTGQVNRMAEESLIKLGPVVGRIFNQTLKPLVERTVNILLRDGHIPPVPEQFQHLVTGYKMELTSPLAQSMKLLHGRAIQTFLQNVAGLASFFPEALDNVHPDQTVTALAEVSSVPLTVLRTPEDRNELRTQRAQQQQAQLQAQAELQERELALQEAERSSVVAKNLSSAGGDISALGDDTGVLQ